ncbi:MAG TPA: transglycosylase domain-containing protein [Bacilli bacterium]|nr:transglycosylase domain-containing protein [Bacilli bacterium]
MMRRKNNRRTNYKKVARKIVPKKIVNKLYDVNKKLKSLSPKKKKKVYKIILDILVFGIIGLIALSLLFFVYIVISAPKFDPKNLRYDEMSFIYDSEGNEIAKLGNKKRDIISYDDVSQVLIDSIIATEDSRFFQHNGFDLPRFLKASFKQALRQRGAGGASTITMQVARNNYTSKNASGIKGIIRKFTDIYLSIFKIEKNYTKKEIFEFYINEPFLGNNAYGIEQASQSYFGKSAKNLNLPEAALLAGLFQSPTYYNPYLYPENAKSRMSTVLYLMQKHGYITEKERKIANSVEIKDIIRSANPEASRNVYQGYIDLVVHELENTYDINPYTTPVKVYTSMIRKKQDFLNTVMDGTAWKWENDLVQTGISMSNVKTGEIVAIGAGRNRTGARQYNYAYMINRQIGSTAKPLFDYGPGIENNGWGSVTYFNDAPHKYSNGASIKNVDGAYKGWLPLYKALGMSRNIPALIAFQKLDNKKIVEFVTSLGITPEISDVGTIHEAHSIGAFNGASPLKMAAAYSAFANGGYYIKPHTINKIVYISNGKENNISYSKQKVMNDSTAFIINYALKWASDSGSVSGGRVSGISIATKTGTTNFTYATKKKYHLPSNALNDLWGVAYTPEYAFCYWYGYDEVNSEHYNTTSTWNTRARYLNLLSRNLFDRTGSNFKMPSSIVSATVEKETDPLMLPSEYTPEDMKITGYFRKGTVPKEVSARFLPLPSIVNLTGTRTGNNISLSWDLPEIGENYLALVEKYGDIGYDIYVKDNSTNLTTYLGTTTGSTYTTTSSAEDVSYFIYTAYSKLKDTKSTGVEKRFFGTVANVSVSLSLGNETIALNSTFADNAIFKVYNNLIDVTAFATVNKTGTVNTTVPGIYSLTYTGTYLGVTKSLTRNIKVQ